MKRSQTPDNKKSNVIEIETKQPPTFEEAAAEEAKMKTSSQPDLKPTKARRGNWIVLTGAIIALLWSAGALAYVIGMSGISALQQMPAAQLSGLVFGTLGPALLIVVLAWTIREVRIFAHTTAHIRDMAERFADPAKAVGKDAKAMSRAVQSQITQVNKSVEGALARLGAMEEVLQHHGDAFAQSEEAARERTNALIDNLRREREAITDLADQLDDKTAKIAHSISEQSKMVVSAADIANTQALSGTKSLSLATQHLQETADTAKTKADQLAEQLSNSTAKIENTAQALHTAKQDMRETLGALSSVQDETNSALAQQKQDVQSLVDLSNQSAAQLQVRANDSAQLMKQSLEDALDQARHYTNIMREEGRALADSHGARAKQLQTAAEEAKSALDSYADVISKRLEHANEASFSAASWADKTLEKLQETTSVLDQRLQHLPQAAEKSARQVEEQFCNRLSELNQAAQNASDEARDIDAAFQSRIRQNYELLSDFMLKMGAKAAPGMAEIEVPNPLAAPTALAAQDTQPIAPQSAPPPKMPLANPPSTPDESEQSAAQKDTGKGWQWKDVLSRIDGTSANQEQQEPSPEHAAKSMDRLADVFQTHNIQPDQLFDATSYRAAALARITDGHKAMLDAAQIDASSAISTLTEIFAKDHNIRLDAELFVAELREKINHAANAGQRIHVETHLHTGDGPAYLLLEAALQA